ncbi:DUF6179 domain-containing protein [Oceanirhabdus sp. W0125-5]|uniref:DUF6179 domain-containing protein n=1 Tax=Oceanirhabdus sp. W0125-5 TaxID=2999116 RepID=UPI0022F30C1B|nr:DUF6179 domain-containing protein [Oceanirhabdus sp. W0125-5]WBW97285.1 DUF6179 domain-containing protein [Oceanirhabdus sp. W0125-5]
MIINRIAAENSIEEIKIKKENLNKNQYTFSILKEGFRLGLIDKNTINNIQIQIMNILKDLITRYTVGESSSVPITTGEKLLASICYCIDAYCDSFNDIEECIDELKTSNIRELYEKGVELVTSYVEETRIFYEKIKKDRLHIELQAYDDTIDEGLGSFFKDYEVVFNAHDTMGSIDYPLTFDDMSIRGINYIKNYLNTLEIETFFCKFFSTEDTIKTLNYYGEIYNTDYRFELINVFEVLINNSIFSVLSGNYGWNLSISEVSYRILNNNLSSLNSKEINILVGKAIEKVIMDLAIDRVELIDYMNKYKSIFIPRLINSLENGNLQNMVVIDREEKNINKNIIFNEGYRANDEDFRVAIQKITKCENIKDKIDLIKSSVQSIYDFIDLLNSNCLFGYEFTELFNSMSDMELSILARMVFQEELRKGTLNLIQAIINKGDIDSEWELHFIGVLQNFDEDRVKLIERYVNNIN